MVAQISWLRQAESCSLTVSRKQAEHCYTSACWGVPLMPEADLKESLCAKHCIELSSHGDLLCQALLAQERSCPCQPGVPATVLRSKVRPRSCLWQDW